MPFSTKYFLFFIHLIKYNNQYNTIQYTINILNFNKLKTLTSQNNFEYSKISSIFEHNCKYYERLNFLYEKINISTAVIWNS